MARRLSCHRLRRLCTLSTLAHSAASRTRRQSAGTGHSRGLGGAAKAWLLFCALSLPLPVCFHWRRSRRLGRQGMPEITLPSYAIAIASQAPHDVARQLRPGSPAVLLRVQEGSTLIDLRTVQPKDEDALLERVLACSLERAPRFFGSECGSGDRPGLQNR
jgi:hypothetical protein